MAEYGHTELPESEPSAEQQKAMGALANDLSGLQEQVRVAIQKQEQEAHGLTAIDQAEWRGYHMAEEISARQIQELSQRMQADIELFRNERDRALQEIDRLHTAYAAGLAAGVSQRQKCRACGGEGGGFSRDRSWNVCQACNGKGY